MTQYYTSALSRVRVHLGQVPFAVGVFESPDHARQIGIAMVGGRTGDGLVQWCLEVRGIPVPGAFVIVDGAFVQVEPASGKRE
jgi:hypothetical protein